MSRRWLELIFGPFRASWRAGLGWSILLALLIVSTVAFWPAFRGSSGISQAIDQLPQALLQAFGLEDFGTAAGYLRGGLYEVLVPLVFSAAGIVFANTMTAGDEDAGRLELFLAQPVTRTAFLAGRSLAVLGWLIVLTLVTLVAQLGSDALFDVPIDTTRVVATIVLCALLGAFMAGVCIAVAGASKRPGLVLSVGFGVAYTSYLVLALFQLSSLLAPWRHISPWDWALGGDPLSNPSDAWRYLVLAGGAVLFAAVGIVGFDRRDVRSA
ncbi:MAG: ABC transporter permease subunit [Candidatus Limnocylindrales bacterium]